jgi:hypothetical protein
MDTPTSPTGPAGARRRGFKDEIDDLLERMARLELSRDDIAAEICRRHRQRPRQAYRLACGWSQARAAQQFNALAADRGADPQGTASMSGGRLCEYEQWPASQRKPSVFVLTMLAALYKTDVLRLLDLADQEALNPRDRLALIQPDRQLSPAGPSGPQPTGLGGENRTGDGLTLTLPFIPGHVLIEVTAAPDTRAAHPQLAVVRTLPAPAPAS